MVNELKDLSIKIEGLTVSYRDKNVLENISFEVDGGKVTALLGPNGSGKTTLLLALCGLLRPRKGRVIIQGEDVTRMKASDRARAIAILPQGLPSFIPFTVYETVLMGRYPLSSPVFFYSRRDRDETEKILKATDLWFLKERKCSELSGGELQRVMLASVFAQETPLLMLDEPTASMDINQQKKIMKMVLDMAAGLHKTIVIATHDLNLVARTCERVAMIMDRDEVLYGNKEKILVEENVRKLFDVDVSAIDIGEETFFM